MTHEIASASTFFCRTDTHCSIEHKESEVEKVKQALALNSYGNNLIETCRQAAVNRPHDNDREPQAPVRYVSVPYIKGTSEKVARILQPRNIKVGHKSNNTIKSQICHVKDKRELLDKDNVIYQV